MVVASELSVKKGYLSPEDGKRIERLLQALKLPTRFPFDGERVLGALRKDKKREGDEIYFVFLQGIGRAAVKKISMVDLEALTNETFGTTRSGIS